MEPKDATVDGLAEIICIPIRHREADFNLQVLRLAWLGILQKLLRRLSFPNLLLCRVGELYLELSWRVVFLFLVATLIHFVSREQLFESHGWHFVFRGGLTTLLRSLSLPTH